MDPRNINTIEIADCLKIAEQAANTENLEAFTDCFCERLRKSTRRRIGMLFVQHVIGLEILDSHVLKQTRTAGEIAVKYRATLSANTTEIVSFLTLTKEGGAWKIGKERIYSSVRQVANSSFEGPGGENVNFDFGGGGAAIRNRKNAFLQGNMGRRLDGCANGRCGL